jgi:hypothetical protein
MAFAALTQRVQFGFVKPSTFAHDQLNQAMQTAHD